MKRLIDFLSVCCIIVFLFTSCNDIYSNNRIDDSSNNQSEPTEIISLNKVNWEEYCLIKPYFLGVEDNKIVTSCWIEIDDNYNVYEEIFVEITVKYDLFYYTTLLGGDETHLSRYYIYSGFVSDDLEELTCQTTYSSEVTKELFQGEDPEITVHQIYGKICK